MNDIFENTETMKENEHPRFYTAESVMRGHPDKLCDLIADSVLDACLQHDPASRVACEVMATHGHIIVAGEITTKRSAGCASTSSTTTPCAMSAMTRKTTRSTATSTTRSPDIAGAVEPELVAVRKAYDLTPAGIIKQLNLLNPTDFRTAAGGHFGDVRIFRGKMLNI